MTTLHNGTATLAKVCACENHNFHEGLSRTLILPNGIEIELVTWGDTFLGLGRVSAANVALRSGRRPMFVDIRNPGGIELFDYQIVSFEQNATSLKLELQPHSRAGGAMEWLLHEVRPRVNTSDWAVEPAPAHDTRLWLEINAVTRQFGAQTWQGFSYQYRYQSTEIPIYKILDRGTWEIGGKASGSEFWLRHGGPPIVSFDSPQQHFSSEWYLPGIANPNIFQFQPWQTQFQGLTFTASSEGLLTTFATEVAHIRSLFEKPRGCDEIVHWHEHCADLSHELTTSPVEVLWLAGNFERSERFNRYEEVRAWLHTELHHQIGMKQERVPTYGLIEEWGEADIDRYRRLGVPKLLEVGVETIALANHFQNNMNVWGVSNMCCNVDFKFSEKMGTEIEKFSRDVKDGGGRVEMWGNTALSTLTYILDNRDKKELPDARIQFLPREGSIMEALDASASPWVRNASGAIEADHYSPVFAQLNLRDQVVRDYWMKRWREANQQFGISGIFLDSSFNMTSDKFSYHYEAQGAEHGATIDQPHLLGYSRPAREPHQGIESQYHAHLSLMVEMQRAGYQIVGEDVGVFGISRSGPGIAMRLDNLALWQDCLLPFDVAAIEKAGSQPDDIFFRGLAYRHMWILYWDIAWDFLSFDYSGTTGPDGAMPYVPNEWHLALLKTYKTAAPLMNAATRRILPDEEGVEYRLGDNRVLWTFEEVTVEVSENTTFTNLRDGSTLTAQTSTTLPKHGVFQIGSAQ
jgi:hypothetical protein